MKLLSIAQLLTITLCVSVITLTSFKISSNTDKINDLNNQLTIKTKVSELVNNHTINFNDSIIKELVKLRNNKPTVIVNSFITNGLLDYDKINVWIEQKHYKGGTKNYIFKYNGLKYCDQQTYFIFDGKKL